MLYKYNKFGEKRVVKTTESPVISLSPNKKRADEFQLMSAGMIAVRRKGRVLTFATITEPDWMTIALYPSFLAPLIWPRKKKVRHLGGHQPADLETGGG